ATVTAVEEVSASEDSSNAWQVAYVLVLIVALILRVYDLDLVPLHHDEGVNGFFLTRLFREGIYQYDPANYHGPTLYYLSLLTAFLFGLTTFAVRLVPALFGVATVWLILLLRRNIGDLGALVAAALVAVSPGAVYMSRYYIHESLFVFFTLGLVIAALRYYEEAKPVYLLLASASTALLFATKETAVISVAVLIIAAITTVIYVRLRRTLDRKGLKEGRRARSKTPVRKSTGQETRQALERFGGPKHVILLSLGTVALFIFVSVLFYSSFFTHSKGVSDALETFKFWTKTGKTAHVHVWYTYLSWLWQEESPMLILGALGACLVLWRADNPLALFYAQWAFGLLAAYSLVPYKTPWLTLNFIIPLAITGGYAVDVIYKWLEGTRERALVLTLAVAAVCVSGYQMMVLNFYHYDDDKYPYVYAHTRREFLQLVDEINHLTTRAGTGAQTKISVTSPDYWPLPWYLRDHKAVGYHGQISVSDEPIVIGSESQEAELQKKLGDGYERINSYALRPGVDLVLYVRRDLAGQ
ncbi:MAG TPA: flippase activity-associated protein Agl23, partial [Pyrinomonadaceae bacterium]|nr:flippase activity-associated protein Agl23 [Pyrinomonadaceae bacterium]